MAGLALVVAIPLSAAAAPPPRAAQPTQDEQRVACTPDAFRLCSHEIPSLSRIIQCLRDNRPNLSVACGRIFDIMEPRGRPATRSMSQSDSVGRFWCAGRRPGEPPRDTWAAWCEEAGIPR